MGNLPRWGLSTAPFYSPAAVEVIPFLGPAANASVDSMDVSKTSSGNPVVGGKLGWMISYAKNGAPVTGITLSTRVGRLSETHSDIGFQ